MNFNFEASNYDGNLATSQPAWNARAYGAHGLRGGHIQPANTFRRRRKHHQCRAEAGGVISTSELVRCRHAAERRLESRRWQRAMASSSKLGLRTGELFFTRITAFRRTTLVSAGRGCGFSPARAFTTSQSRQRGGVSRQTLEGASPRISSQHSPQTEMSMRKQANPGEIAAEALSVVMPGSCTTKGRGGIEQEQCAFARELS